jgi:hypothetical protein
MPYEDTANKLIEAGLLVILAIVILVIAAGVVILVIVLYRLLNSHIALHKRGLDIQEKSVEQIGLLRVAITQMDQGHGQLLRDLGVLVARADRKLNSLALNVKEQFDAVNRRIDDMGARLDTIIRQIIESRANFVMPENPTELDLALEEYSADIERAVLKLAKAQAMIDSARSIRTQEIASHDSSTQPIVPLAADDLSGPSGPDGDLFSPTPPWPGTRFD